MKTVGIIQARMGSTRLPGKVLKDLCGKSVLARVISRVQQSRYIDAAVVATSTSPIDEAIIEECKQLSTETFSGSETDVLDRYYGAALKSKVDVVVRITSDCPLIDPNVCDDIIRAFLVMRPDYASNTQVRTYPRGLDTEVMTFAALETAWREAQEPYEREHVTPYLYQRPHRFRLLSITGDSDLSRYRWTIDTPEDLAFMRAVYDRIGQSGVFSWKDVVRIVEQDPTLIEINQHIEQKTLWGS